MSRLVRFLTIVLLPSLLGAQYRTLRLEPLDPSLRQNFDKQVRVALVVGISGYPEGSGLSALKYASRDADVLSEALRAQGYLVKLLKDASATGPLIRRTLRELSDAVSPEQGTMLFFFAGHGYGFKGDNYLATYELTADDLNGGGLAVKTVEDLLRASKAKRKVMLLDACRNDPEQGSRSVNLRSFADLQASEGIRELYSTKSGKISYEYDALRQGVFTYFLAKGLAGEAAGADGLVTFHDLSEYVTDRMRAYTVENGKEVQIPFEAGESSGDFLLSAGAPRASPASRLTVPSPVVSETPPPVATVPSKLPGTPSLPKPDSIGDLLEYTGKDPAGGFQVQHASMANCVLELYIEHFAGEAGTHRNNDGRVVLTIPLNVISRESIAVRPPDKEIAFPSVTLAPQPAIFALQGKNAKYFSHRLESWRNGRWVTTARDADATLTIQNRNPDVRTERIAEALANAAGACQK